MIFGAAIAAFVFQAVVILIDEFHFHRRRFLPRWELVGHPIDTFCLLSFFLVLTALSSEDVRVFWLASAIGLISCLVITKDEWVHKQYSSGNENWLHALLFIVHPVVVGLFLWLWWRREDSLKPALAVADGAIALHLIYQLVEAIRRWPVANPSAIGPIA